MDQRAAVRRIVLDRDRECQLAAVGTLSGFDVGRCYGRLEVHEIRKASQGGTYSEDNGVALCAHHNSQLEADADLAAFARTVGLVRRRGD